MCVLPLIIMFFQLVLLCELLGAGTLLSSLYLALSPFLVCMCERCPPLVVYVT